MKKIIVLILLIFLAGCFGKVEINELPIVTAIGVDKSEEGIKVTTQVIRPKVLSGQQQGINGTNIIVYSQEGPSVSETLTKMSVFYKNRVFLGHFQLLVFGEDFAKEGFKDAIEFFFESPRTRQRFLIAVVKGGKAEDLLKIQTPMLDTPANEINSTIDNNAKYFGTSIVTYADEVYASPLADEFDVAITGLEIKGDPKEGSETKGLESSDLKTKITVCGIAIFKKDKLVGWLNKDESIGYNRLRGLLKSTIHTTKFENGDITSMETLSGKLKHKVKIVDNMPEITIDYKVEGVVPSVSTKMFLEKKDVIYLEQKLSEIIKGTMEKAIKKIQEYKSDAVYFGEVINDQHPKYWKLIEKDFDELLPKIKVIINVSVKIINQAN